MIEIIEEDVRAFDMRRLAQLVEGRTRSRFLAETGEHYRLLAYLSEQYAGGIFYDVGTLNGGSAVALAAHPDSCVTSWDITEKARVAGKFAWPTSPLPSVEFRIKDIFDEPTWIYDVADVICLDISPHDGIQEQRFTDALDTSGFEGLLICDDIRNVRFPGMTKWWEAIDRPKWELSYAHCSGTGLVSYGEEFKVG